MNNNRIEKLKHDLEREVDIDRQRKAHHAALRKLAAQSIKDDGLRLWRKLMRVEVAARAASMRHANEGLSDEQHRDAELAAIAGVKRVLGVMPDGFHFNWDARGNALKIDPERGEIPDGMFRDFGGYGLLAPVIK